MIFGWKHCIAAHVNLIILKIRHWIRISRARNLSSTNFQVYSWSLQNFRPKNWFLTIFGLKTLHCKSRPVGKIKNPTPESDFSGRNTFQCQFSHLNIDFLKFYTDLSPISKMGACHTIQDGGINVGRVYWQPSVYNIRQPNVHKLLPKRPQYSATKRPQYSETKRRQLET